MLIKGGIRMRKWIVLLVAVLMVGVFLTACGSGKTDGGGSSGGNSSSSGGSGGGSGSGGSGSGSTSKMVIKVGHGGAPGDVINQSVDVFKQYVEERTNGRYEIQNFGASQLGNERDLIEGVSLGTVEMTLVTNAPLGNFVPEALFYDLPGLFNGLDHVHKVAESPIVQEWLKEKLLGQNLRLLAVTDGGFRNITNNVRPIVELSDLQGIKMRVQESPMIVATYNAIPGVSPVPIPIGDLYSALEQKIVDAQENPALLINDFKFYEVQKYLSLTEHSYFPRHLLINENVWQKIPPEDQEIFLEAAKKLQTFKNDYYARENPKMIDELKSKGMEVNEVSAQFKEQFAALMQEKVYPEFYDEIGGGDAAKGREIVEEIIRLGNE